MGLGKIINFGGKGFLFPHLWLPKEISRNEDFVLIEERTDEEPTHL